MNRPITVTAIQNGSPGVYTERTSEPVIACTYATGPLKLRLGSDAAIDLAVGEAYGIPNGPALGRIEILNFGSSDVQASLFLGKQRTSSVSIPAGLTTGRDYPTGSGPVTLVKNTYDIYLGIKNVTYNFKTFTIRRRLIRVSNTHASLVLTLSYANPELGVLVTQYAEEVQPKTTAEIATSCDVHISNLSLTTDMTYKAAEFFDVQSNT